MWFCATADAILTAHQIVLGLLIADALSLVLIAILFGLRLHLNLMDQTGQAERRTKKRILIVAKVLSGLFTGQVIAGLGEAIAAYVTLNFDDPNPDDPHPALAADLTMLSGLIGVASISLLWTLLLDRNSPGVTVRLFISGSLGLMGWTLQIPTLKSATQALARFWVCTAYLGLSLIVLLVHSPKKGKMPSNVTRTVLAIHFIFAFAALIYFLIDAMVIRFGHSGLCSLKVKEEDVWTFGQIVALVLLLSPVLATVDAISGEAYALSQR